MSKIYGTTLYLASSKINTRYGSAIAHTFQDLISKEYSLVLTFGTIKKNTSLLARIHSSCLTSETLRAFDSDDVQQLEGALAAIQKSGSGILYYFIQEGRGAGFISKAKDRMLVQGNPGLTSHQAFHLCGLKSDYRTYDRIRDINSLLDIRAPLILLTNNPDKFSSLRSLGVKIKSSRPLEIHPTSHSAAYLESKRQKGHRLVYKSTGAKAILKPPAPVKPFEPYSVPNALRFIHTASYRLPVKPVNGALFFDKKTWKDFSTELHARFPKSAIDKILLTEHLLADSRIEVRINRTELKLLAKESKKNRELLYSLLEVPYWFTLHAYWDISSGEEFVVLEYVTSKRHSSSIPVRVQSESLFNRFPLEDMEDRDKFKKSLYYIAQKGHGLIVLLHNDGRGAGFGALAIEKMMRQKNPSLTSEDVYTHLGLQYDLRDYSAAALLIKHHIRSDDSIQLLASCAASVSKKPESIASFAEHEIPVNDLCFLESDVRLPKLPSSSFGGRLLKKHRQKPRAA